MEYDKVSPGGVGDGGGPEGTNPGTREQAAKGNITAKHKNAKTNRSCFMLFTNLKRLIKTR
jgi:hypothetical protein